MSSQISRSSSIWVKTWHKALTKVSVPVFWVMIRHQVCFEVVSAAQSATQILSQDSPERGRQEGAVAETSESTRPFTSPFETAIGALEYFQLKEDDGYGPETFTRLIVLFPTNCKYNIGMMDGFSTTNY
jgi:hypothetical protein